MGKQRAHRRMSFQAAFVTPRINTGYRTVAPATSVRTPRHAMQPGPDGVIEPLGKLYGEPVRFSAQVRGMRQPNFVFLKGGPTGKAFISGHLVGSPQWRILRNNYDCTIECIGLRQEGHASLYATEVVNVIPPEILQAAE